MPRSVLSGAAMSPDELLLEAWQDSSDGDVHFAIVQAKRVLALRAALPDWRDRLRDRRWPRPILTPLGSTQ